MEEKMKKKEEKIGKTGKKSEKTLKRYPPKQPPQRLHKEYDCMDNYSVHSIGPRE